MKKSMFLKREYMQKLFALIAILFFNILGLQAQASNPDFFQSIGKIYVVVAVVVISFLGIVFFLIYLERKLGRMEKEITELKLDDNG